MQRILMQPGSITACALPAIAGMSANDVAQSAADGANVIVDARGLVVGGAALVVQLVDGALRLSGGSSGEIYLITIKASNLAGLSGEAEIEVECLDQSWSMPDGGAAWLTVAQFVARFGHEEVVRMSDLRGDGRIDRDLLVNALIDAQAIAEAHIKGVAAIDAGAVPALLQGIIADLARARLYPGGAPEGIDAQARMAMRNLEKLQSGGAKLGMASAAEPEAAPILIRKKPSRYADDLKGY